MIARNDDIEWDKALESVLFAMTLHEELAETDNSRALSIIEEAPI